ncbi:MAG: transcription termination factor Rho [Collinsella sp.]|nr:transcription termination factor Rho [Collinsella sp.]
MAEQEKNEAPEAVAEEAAPRPRRARKPRAAASADAIPAIDILPPAASAAAPEAGEAKPRRRGRPRKTAAAPAEEVSGEVAQARALSQVSQAEVARKQRAEEDRVAEAIASGSAAPLIDPALRPHRRGRKPKAYVEAERAAAAALAAKQAEYMEQRELDRKEAPAPAPADTRPGRARRAEQKAAPEEAPAEGDTPREQDAAEQAPRTRRRQRTAPDRPAAPEHATERAGGGSDRSERTHGTERNADRGNDRNNRNNNRQQGGNRNKRNNNRYNAPSEPSVSREDLTALKVADLREKAKEFGIDYVGKKKAELVEDIYTASARAEGFREITGILDIDNQGFGNIRAHGYMPSRDDAFVAANMIRAAGLRAGDLISGTLRPLRANDKYPGLAKIHSVNGVDPEQMRHRPKFSDLTPIYPNEPLRMEHGRDSITGRAIDIVAPVGKGQRGLIVSPPKAGKTTILKRICQAIALNNPEVHLICLLVDERPEEVTDMQRSIKGDVVASTFDMPADNHTRVSELVIERAKRLVELGEDVVVVLDSITRLARAYNLAAPASGRILSGGVDSAALYPPKRFLGAARNIENGGSLTILASALVDTGSKMDEVIFEEFKGTGNMELKLDRDLADRRIFPAIDPVASGTRNEDLLIDEQMRPFVWGIRRVLANMNNTERSAASFIKGLKATDSNQEFLVRTAKKAQDHPEAL